MDFATTLGNTVGKAASGAGALAASMPQKKQRMNQAEFRKLLMLMQAQEGGESRPLPKGRAVGFGRSKRESDMDYLLRKAQGIPGGGKPSGLSELYALQDRSLTPEEARIKAGIIESEGGQIGTGGTVSKRGSRQSPQSSTGRAYDPVAARKAFLANASTAIRAKKQEQAADASVAAQTERSARTPGTIRGMANQYGFGQAKTLTPQEFANRPEAMVTLGRNKPFTLPLREEIDILKREQSRK